MSVSPCTVVIYGLGISDPIELLAGAYTRRLFNSTQAAETKYTLNTAFYPLTPPESPLDKP